MTKTSKGKKPISHKEYVSVESYRALERYRDMYKFNSIEQTVNVILDFVQSPLDCKTFHEYVMRCFPSKFT